MRTKLLFATNNANKLREARQILEPMGFEILSMKDAGVDIEPDETGTTFVRNAEIKACDVYNELEIRMPVIADDSGLCVDALGGRPGVWSARYAPEGERCQKLLDEMKDVPEGKRSAYFECAIVYVDKYVCESFTGRCEGTIGYEERGENGFGYDPIFLRDGRTLAEMSSEEKNAISHRGAAMEKLVSYLKESYGV
ncbi:MAG: RdgB/HAM1 family non-canonical purine NTP pyrophosphatase [Ruminococcus sp.]|nr:RdgB/HAM1 family non-canonical purine NTP pyrophosphatase [Ruminococcus sp.]HOR21977.1 RdgB/HAM1 family non-canonical purine NTP pyrophosphatase [Ruminococcus sp.]